MREALGTVETLFRRDGGRGRVVCVICKRWSGEQSRGCCCGGHKGPRMCKLLPVAVVCVVVLWNLCQLGAQFLSIAPGCVFPRFSSDEL